MNDEAPNQTADAMGEASGAAFDPATGTSLSTEAPDLTRTTRDHEELRAKLEAWLSSEVTDAAITELAVPDSGMSSETVLFGASWIENGERVETELVARLAADSDAVPVFPTYDLEAQYRAIQLVGRHTDAPVPGLRWLVEDPSVLGAPFFVMDRARGDVPADVMPYTIEGALLEASAVHQSALQNASVDVLAEIHRTPLGAETDFLEVDQPGDTALRRHLNHWIDYANWVRDGRNIALLDEAQAWLEANWPDAADTREPALSWGDARIGNIMYNGPAPVAVLDWEMAGIAPVEVDLGWMSFLHTFFQDIAVELELAGMPDFMRAEDVSERYRATSGTDIEDLHWFCTYAAYRHAAIMVRVIDRQIHFGDTEPNDDPEQAIIHRVRLREMIST